MNSNCSPTWEISVMQGLVSSKGTKRCGISLKCGDYYLSVLKILPPQTSRFTIHQSHCALSKIGSIEPPYFIRCLPSQLLSPGLPWYVIPVIVSALIAVIPAMIGTLIPSWNSFESMIVSQRILKAPSKIYISQLSAPFSWNLGGRGNRFGKSCARTSCVSETNNGYRIGDPDLFFSACFVLAKETNLNALVTWVNIYHGTDTTTLHHISEDKNTIDVSITRKTRQAVSTITCHLKDAGVYFEPAQQLWINRPLTQELRLQHNRARGFQLTSQNSSTTKFDASKGLDRAATPPLPHLSEISGSDQEYSQQSGSAVSAEASLQYTSPTTSAIRDVGSASDAQPSPQPLSAAQTPVDLSEQQGSDAQHTPSLSSAPHPPLGLSDEQTEPASDEDRSPLPFSAAPTLTANSFSDQQSGSASDNHRSPSSPTLTTGSFCGTESDGNLPLPIICHSPSA